MGSYNIVVMMTIDVMIALMAFAFVSSITPGPNNLMLLASGINFGLSRSLPHMFGVGFGFTAMIVLVGFGIAQIFDLFPVSYTVLKILSGIYLTYLAWKIATTRSFKGQSDKQASQPMSFLQAVLFQWVNPKAWMMALTAIGTYTSQENSLLSIFLVAAIFGAINLPSVGAWTILGTQLQRLLTDPMKLKFFNITAAILLMASLYPVLFKS